MSYSLHIRNGDLNPSGPGGIAVVSGQQKLIQDLKHAILEPRGTDPMNPSFGSTLDGGLLPDGTVVGTNIGQSITRERIANIEAEVRRVLASYQKSQIARLQRESAKFGGKNTFSAGEVLQSVDNVEVFAVQDVVVVRVALRTASGARLQLLQPVGSG